MKIPMGVSYVFLLIGTVLLTAAVYYGRDTLLFLGQSAKTEGTVVALKSTPPDLSRGVTTPTYRPVVRFVTGDGQTIDFTATMGLDAPQYLLGATLSVAYSPANPRNARIDDLSLWMIELVLGALGGVFALFGGGTLLARGLMERRGQYLRDHGMPVQTEFVRTVRHRWLMIEGRRPFMVETRWRNPVNAETRIFRSDPLMFDPTQQIRSKAITVFIDREHPRKYHVDLSFLAGAEAVQ